MSSTLQPLPNVFRIGVGGGIRYYTPIGPIPLHVVFPTNPTAPMTTRSKSTSGWAAFSMRRPLIVIAWIAGAITLLIAVLAGLVLIGGNTDSGRRLHRADDRSADRGSRADYGAAGLFTRTADDRRAAAPRRARRMAQRGARRGALGALEAARAPCRCAKSRSGACRVRASAGRLTGIAGRPDRDPGHRGCDCLDRGAAGGTRARGRAHSVTLHGAVLLRSLEDASGDVSARRLGGDGSYDLHFHFDRRRMDGRLQMREPAQGPLQNFLQVPGLGALAGVATISGERSAEHVEIQLDAGNLHGRAQGEINLIQGSAEVDYSRRVRRCRRAPISAGARSPCTAAGTARRRLRAPRANCMSNSCNCPAAGASRI